MSAPDGFGFLLLVLMVLPIWMLCIGEILRWLTVRSTYLYWEPVRRNDLPRAHNGPLIKRLDR